MEKNKAFIRKTLENGVYIVVNNEVIATMENVFGDETARMRNAEKIVSLWNKSIRNTKKKTN